MKTPDEIKRGLEHCNRDVGCFGCPYLDRCADTEIYEPLLVDALAYIRQLEAERDAAVDELTKIIYKGAGILCKVCKHKGEHKCAKICGYGYKGFEWRGLPEPPKEE